MGLFDSLLNLIGGAADAVQGSAGDVVGGLTDGAGEAASAVAEQGQAAVDGAGEAASAVTEPAQTAVDDITNNLGL